MNTSLKTTLAAMGLLASGFFASTHASTTGDNLVLKVNGMVCAYCAQGIEKRLAKLPQTASVYVNLAQKVVAVQAKPGQKFDVAKIKAEVVDAGYEVASLDTTSKTTAQIKADWVAKK